MQLRCLSTLGPDLRHSDSSAPYYALGTVMSIPLVDRTAVPFEPTLAAIRNRVTHKMPS